MVGLGWKIPIPAKYGANSLAEGPIQSNRGPFINFVPDAVDLLRESVLCQVRLSNHLSAKSYYVVREVSSDYRGGLRYPHLERIEGTPAQLDAILAPRLPSTT